MLRPLRNRFVLTCALLGLASVAHAGLLPDSTLIDGWRLPNGLEVRARHIPQASGIAITVAYRAGSLNEPAGREGLADLMAELAFLAPAGDTPERTRDEMASIRPLGWSLRVNEHVALLTEIATNAQFPGVLHQVASRMRGVTVTEPVLRTALVNVRQSLGERRFGPADIALYYRVRDLALGRTDEQLLRRAGKALDGVTLKEVDARLHAAYVPANAVLAIAGDLTSANVRQLVEAEFGAIPAGTPTAEAPEPVLRAATRTSPWNGITRRGVVIGVIAPALSDSLHPAFYLGALLTGAYMRDTYGPPTPPIRSRFQYSLLDEPDLVRFYPALMTDTTTTAGASSDFSTKLDLFAGSAVDKPMLDQVRYNVLWLIGGLIGPEMRKRMRADVAPLATLTSSMATRASWRGDEFWDRYQSRFLHSTLGHNVFMDWMAEPSHQAVLEFTPER